MNPKYLDTYIGGLQKTLQEKLFFVDVLGKNFFANKIIIDFGCGDGEVLSYIAKHCYCEGSAFCAIDQSARMLALAEDKIDFKNITFAKSLKDVIIDENSEVVFIASSVLHELDNTDKKMVCEFIRDRADYVIVRDMCITNPYSSSMPNNDLLSEIILGANTKMLAEFIKVWGSSVKSLLHFLLKYTYVENWETEIEENYLSVQWTYVGYLEKQHNFEVIYDNSYIQNWRADRVEKDFGIKLSDYTSSTHRQVILRRKEKNDE